MIEALVARLAIRFSVGWPGRNRRPDRNGWLATVADDVAMFWLAQDGSRLPGTFADLRYLNQSTRTFRFPVAS
jgi:hypothetical protein